MDTATAVINVRIDQAIKTEAQNVVEQLGFSLSTVIKGFLKSLVRTKRIEFDLNNEVPNAYMIKALKQSEEDYRRGDYYSFDNPKEAIKFLDTIRKRAKKR